MQSNFKLIVKLLILSIPPGFSFCACEYKGQQPAKPKDSTQEEFSTNSGVPYTGPSGYFELTNMKLITLALVNKSITVTAPAGSIRTNAKNKVIRLDLILTSIENLDDLFNGDIVSISQIVPIESEGVGSLKIKFDLADGIAPSTQMILLAIDGRVSDSQFGLSEKKYKGLETSVFRFLNGSGTFAPIKNLQAADTPIEGDEEQDDSDGESDAGSGGGGVDGESTEGGSSGLWSTLETISQSAASNLGFTGTYVMTKTVTAANGKGLKVDTTHPVGIALSVRTTSGGSWSPLGNLNDTDSACSSFGNVSIDGLGNGWIIWDRMRTDGTAYDIYGRRYEINGNISAPEVIFQESEGIGSLDVACATTGTCLAIGTRLDSLNYTMWARVYETATGWGEVLKLSDGSFPDTYSEYPHITVDEADDFTVVWIEKDKATQSTRLYKKAVYTP